MKKIEEYSAIASSPKLMGAAAFAFLAKQFFDIASSNAKSNKKRFRFNVSESASLGAKNNTIKSFSLLGGDGEQMPLSQRL